MMDTLHPVDDPASGTPGSCFQGFPHTQRTSAANQAAATGFSTPPAAPGSWAPGSWGPPIPPPRFCTTDSSHQSPVACQVSGLMAATWPPPAGHGQQNCFQQQSATTAQDSALAELTQQFQDSMHMRRIPGQPALSTSCAHHASQDSPDAYEARCYYGGCRWCKAALCQSCARRCDGCGVTDLCLVCASGFLPQGVRLEGELTLCPGCLRSHTEAPAAVASTPIQQQQFQQQQSSSLFKFVGGVGQLIGGSGNTASTANGGHDDDDAMML
mmetsp:Transcript_14963/g.22760  ORF Transcript_14963/g.22760 Transcript_14963/m.22760 type:complete len:270 (+) Transcript_14963:426-1235(+)|eukprot:CAMPEP_0206400226 /NCGR_PEP_ID=MMETSP0294-20121207/25389_1 /ASSEMBLY_ACC=CAM_ASM_000327 /TAXON_ID=39354 /ORGANISM="Heterosigma akashiwo, Strain CCMP2393" /LENGTH=269 /DNA_ID=CAMNT_0053856377 /DNA_START=377 /DNA_END=1186 /DNA_ORIENTATION=+